MSVEKKQGAQSSGSDVWSTTRWKPCTSTQVARRARKVFCYNYINRKITARVSVAGAVGRSCACAEFAHALSDERGAAVRLSRAILDLDHRLRHGLSALAISWETSERVSHFKRGDVIYIKLKVTCDYRGWVIIYENLDDFLPTILRWAMKMSSFPSEAVGRLRKCTT